MRLGVIYAVLSIITIILLGGVATAVAIHFTKDKKSPRPPSTQHPTTQDIPSSIVNTKTSCWIPESGTGKYYVPVPNNMK